MPKPFKLASIQQRFIKEIEQTQEEMRLFQTDNLVGLLCDEGDHFKGNSILAWNEQINIIDKVLVRRRNGEQILTNSEASEAAAKIKEENFGYAKITPTQPSSYAKPTSSSAKPTSPYYTQKKPAGTQPSTYAKPAVTQPSTDDDMFQANLSGYEETFKNFEIEMCSKEVGELYSKRQEIAEKIIKIRLWLSRQGVKISADGKTIWWPREKKMLWDQQLFQQGFSQVEFVLGKIYWSQHGAGLTPEQWELTNSSRSVWVQQGPKWVRSNQPIPVDTKSMVTYLSGPGAGIYVFSKEGHLHISSHKVGQRHHSSLLAGGDVACAGEIWVTQGTITAISNKSGHYHPQTHHLKQMLEHLSEEAGLDIASLTVKKYSSDGFITMNGRTFLES